MNGSMMRTLGLNVNQFSEYPAVTLCNLNVIRAEYAVSDPYAHDLATLILPAWEDYTRDVVLTPQLRAHLEAKNLTEFVRTNIQPVCIHMLTTLLN